MTKRITDNIPNAITCCNLLAGTLACIAAFSGDSTTIGNLSGYQLAWICIGAAAIFDFCDGMAARLLGAYSLLGKELDSLADLVSFGLAPGLLMYNLLQATSPLGWLPWIALCIPVIGALRLARFNVDDRQTTSFIGLPIPSNAIFWIGFSAWILASGNILSDPAGTLYPWAAWATAFIIPAMALMMVSPLPMFSLKFKSMRPAVNKMRYFIILATIVLLIVTGVPGLSVAILLYILVSSFEALRR